jgi:hypothetical protein
VSKKVLVDTFAEETVATDSLGRRTGLRRQHTIEEKLRIVQETHVRGASVATVASVPLRVVKRRRGGF